MSRMRPQRPTIGPSALFGRPAPEARGSSSREETQFHARQIEHQTPLVIRLRDGEELSGVLEWYDRASLRLNLAVGGHRIVQKSAISTICRVV